MNINQVVNKQNTGPTLDGVQFDENLLQVEDTGNTRPELANAEPQLGDQMQQQADTRPQLNAGVETATTERLPDMGRPGVMAPQAPSAVAATSVANDQATELPNQAPLPRGPTLASEVTMQSLMDFDWASISLLPRPQLNMLIALQNAVCDLSAYRANHDEVLRHLVNNQNNPVIKPIPNCPKLGVLNGLVPKDFKAFESSFWIIKRVCGWSDADGKDMLMTALKGAAHERLHNAVTNWTSPTVTCEHILEIWDQQIRPEAHTQNATISFQTAAQGPNENPFDFMQRTRYLFIESKKDEPDKRNPDTSRPVILRILEGLSDKTLANTVRRQGCNTYQCLLNCMRREYDMLQRRPIPAIGAIDPTNKVPAARCEFCNKPGHSAKDCYARQKFGANGKNGWSNPRGRGNSRGFKGKSNRGRGFHKGNGPSGSQGPASKN